MGNKLHIEAKFLEKMLCFSGEPLHSETIYVCTAKFGAIV